MARNQNDWGALAMAELRGQEPAGTVSRLMREATGKCSAEEDVAAALKFLTQRAEALKAADVKQAVADLDRAAQTVLRVSMTARTEQAKLARAKEDLAAERVKTETANAREIESHRATLAAALAELDGVKKQATNLRVKAEADAVAAAKAKGKAAVDRMLRAVEGLA